MVIVALAARALKVALAAVTVHVSTATVARVKSAASAVVIVALAAHVLKAETARVLTRIAALVAIAHVRMRCAKSVQTTPTTKVKFAATTVAFAPTVRRLI